MGLAAECLARFQGARGQLCFAAPRIAYLFVENAFVQKMPLSLGSPAHAVAAAAGRAPPAAAAEAR